MGLRLLPMRAGMPCLKFNETQAKEREMEAIATILNAVVKVGVSVAGDGNAHH